MDIKQIFKIEEVKSVLIALAITIFLGDLVQEQSMRFSGIFLSIIIMVGLSWFLSTRIQGSNYKTNFIIGTLTYGGYIAILYFFKLYSVSIDISGEIISAVIFGGICTGIAYLLNKF